MAERLSKLLRQKVAGIWEAQHQPPFVRGIGDGTLGLETSFGCDTSSRSGRRTQPGLGDDGPLR
jgi:hypothetical protein